MAEVIHVFDAPLVIDTRPYVVQVCARAAGTIWEGWIEFASIDGTDVRRSRRETTQPNRRALEYWSGGLSATYLEGAFARTSMQPVRHARKTPATSFFNAPAPVPPAVALGDQAVLDPFSVGAKGEDLLRRELSALQGWHLRNIVRTYDLADESTDLESLSDRALVELIIQAVAAS